MLKRFAPLLTTTEVTEPRALLTFRFVAPPLAVNVPEKSFAMSRSNIPEPILVRLLPNAGNLVANPHVAIQRQHGIGCQRNGRRHAQASRVESEHAGICRTAQGHVSAQTYIVEDGSIGRAVRAYRRTIIESQEAGTDRTVYNRSAACSAAGAERKRSTVYRGPAGVSICACQNVMCPVAESKCRQSPAPPSK